MARGDKETYGSYDKDVFDNPPAGPVGVHRGKRSLMARVSPFVAVVVAAALAGVLAWGFVSGEFSNIRMPWAAQETTGARQSAAQKPKSDGASDAKDDKAADEDKAGESKPAEDAGEGDAQQNEQQPEQPEATVNKATAVLVINGTGLQGYAAEWQGVLANAGYTSATAANPTGSLPAASVVWYQNETDKATAEDVAATLGIADVQQVDGLDVPIAVVRMA